jgi:hypothetical protein
MLVLRYRVGAYNIANSYNFLVKISKNSVKHYFQKIKNNLRLIGYPTIWSGYKKSLKIFIDYGLSGSRMTYSMFTITCG